MNKIIASVILCGLAPLVGFGGVHADAGAVAKEAGFVIDDMKGVPGAFRPGAFAFKVTLHNTIEEPLRGYVTVKAATSDKESPDFASVASATIDLTLPSANPAPGVYELKGELATNLVWRDVKVVVETRGKEIVLSDGYVEGTGRRPARIALEEQAQKKVVPGENPTREGKVRKGDDLYPDGFRVAFIAPDGEADPYEESADRADWEVEKVYDADAKGWRKLAANLGEYDAVVSLAGFPEEVDGEAFTNFVAQGGVLWINGVNDRNEILGLAAFDSIDCVPGVKVREVADGDTVNHIVGEGWGQWGRRGPRGTSELGYPMNGEIVVRVPNTKFTYTREQDAAWPSIANAYGKDPGSVLARRRFGKGLVYLGTTPSADAQFYANLRFHAGLQTKEDLIFWSWGANLIPPNVCNSEAKDLHGGSSTSFKFYDLRPGSSVYRMTLKATDENGLSRTAWKRVVTEPLKPNASGRVVDVSVGLDNYGLSGKTRYTAVFEDLTRGFRAERDFGEIDNFPYLEIRAPFYRGWVSPKRLKPEVTIGVTLHDDAAVGKTVTLETYDTEGGLLARQTGEIRQFRRGNDKSVWFEVPVAQDAPCGEYRLVAKVDRDDGEFVTESKFEIRPIVEGQVMYDQDGTLMNEGRRFYGYGGFHLGFFDDPIGPWTYDTNTNTEVRSPECLKEDGTPFTLWDVGFTFSQCWENDWNYNFLSDPEKLKTCDPLRLFWAYYGREKMYKPLYGVDHAKLRPMCKEAIDKEPNFYEKLAAKNALRAKKAKEKGMLFSVEMGLPAYEQMCNQHNYMKPWNWTVDGPDFPYMRNDYAQVRQEVRDLLKNDKEHTVGAWYVLDEAGSGRMIHDQDNIAREEDPLHPLMLLGEVASLHGCVDIGCDQIGSDCNPTKYMHMFNTLFTWGLHHRSYTAPHGGAIICCHRAADEEHAVDQTLETLWTYELTAMMTGVNGSMLYTWKEDGRPIRPYGSGWSFTRPRELAEIVRRIKTLEPYFLNGMGTMAKSRNGFVRARICGDKAKAGEILMLANFERFEKTSVKLHIPELAGKTLEPMFEKDAKPVVVDAKGDFEVGFEPDVSRVLKVKGQRLEVRD